MTEGRQLVAVEDQLGPVRPQHRFDEAALAAWLAERLDGFGGKLAVRQFQGGQSNPTFELATPARRCVLRKKPPGKLLPSAHQVEREYRVLSALAGSAVPVPRPLLLCEDAAVIGTEFYVMEFVDGRIFADPALPGLAPEERRAVYDGMIAVLAELHGFDWRAGGLEGFGRPQGYVARQIERWSQQYKLAETEPIAEMDRLIAWLRERRPEEGAATIAHGDYRLGNLILHPSEPRILAVLDWEIATIGDPLADLGYAAIAYRRGREGVRLDGLLGLDLAALGIPDEAAFVAAYCALTGRAGIPDWPFYLAFSLFRLAAIAQGVYARSLQGNAADRSAGQFGIIARGTAEAGWSVARQAGG